MAREIWTFSRLKARMNCPMAEHLRYGEELVLERFSEPLATGTAVHKGIETRSIEEALKTFDGIQPADQAEENELEIARATVTGMLTGFFERFEPFEQHSPEMQFELPLLLKGGKKSRKHYIAGKMDDLAAMDDGDWIIEYKTAGQLNQGYFDRLYVDEQITMYMYAANRLGYRPKGVIYRVIRKPTIRPHKGESIAQYTDRLAEDYTKRPEFYYFEQRLYRPQDQLEDFEESLRERILTFYAEEQKGRHYRNPSQCTNYGTCPYLPLCAGEAGAETLYTHRAPNEELRGD